MLRRLSIASVTAVVGSLALGACSATESPGGSDDPSVALPGAAPGSSGGTFGGPTPTPPDAPTAPRVCAPDKSNAEILGDTCDDDADGALDNRVTCDGTVTGSTAEEVAKAIGICDKAQTRGFGLVSAKLTRGYNRTDAPNVKQHSALAKFGSVLRPREGQKLAVLSSGYAQEFNGSPGARFGGNVTNGKEWFSPGANGSGTAPPGFPQQTGDCSQSRKVNDVVDLHLELKAPKNATGFKFDFNFHSSEWPGFICSAYNDAFTAYVSAKGFNKGVPGNMSFDAKKNPVSVNNAFFDRCTPNTVIGCYGGFSDGQQRSTCPGGPQELAGTGFGVTDTYCDESRSVSGGATGWLTSQAAVQPGETFTLDLMIWDALDGDLDSLVLLDNFRWIAGDIVTATERPKGPN